MLALLAPRTSGVLAASRCARCASVRLLSSLSEAAAPRVGAAEGATVGAAAVAAAPAGASAGGASTPSAAPLTPQRTGAFGQVFSVGRLDAVRRDAVGKSSAKWARTNGFIPGLIYGGSMTRHGAPETIRIYIKELDLREEANRRGVTFLNTLYDIVVDGVAHRVLPRDFQLHPFRPKIVCCNWVRYAPGRAPGVKLDIPLRPINEERCIAFKSGGWLLELTRKLPVFAHGDEVPDYLVMDLRGKKLGDKIMASEVELHAGLTMRGVPGKDYAVAKFVGSKRRAGEVDEDAASAAGGDKAPAAKAPAAGGKAPADASAAPAKAGGAASGGGGGDAKGGAAAAKK